MLKSKLVAKKFIVSEVFNFKKKQKLNKCLNFVRADPPAIKLKKLTQLLNVQPTPLSSIEGKRKGGCGGVDKALSTRT